MNTIELQYHARKAKNGNKESLEKLIKDSYNQLFKTAYLYVSNENDALDIVQESVIKIIRKINTLKHPKYVRSWMVRVAINTSLDFIKRDKQDEQMKNNHINSKSLSVSNSVDLNLDLYEAIKKLAPSLQEIIIMYYFYGYSMLEISSILEIPLGTIKSDIYRSKTILKKFLRGDN